MNSFSNIFSNNSVNQYGSDFSTFSVSKTLESFDTHGYNTNNLVNGNVVASSVISNQIYPLNDITNDYSNKIQNIDTNYVDLKTNINALMDIRKNISGNEAYDYNTPFSLNKPKTVLDGLIYDNNQLSVQENAMFVLGTITAATLIVLAIVIGKE